MPDILTAIPAAPLSWFAVVSSTIAALLAWLSQRDVRRMQRLTDQALTAALVERARLDAKLVARAMEILAAHTPPAGELPALLEEHDGGP